MANMVTLKVKGLKELDRALQRMQADMAGGILVDALEDGAKVIVDEAKRLVPVRTGKLRDAIKTGNVKTGVGAARETSGRFIAGSRTLSEASIDIGVDYTFKGGAVRYGHLVEFGTKRGARANPFMRPAFESRKNQAIAVFKDRLWQRIQAVARRG